MKYVSCLLSLVSYTGFSRNFPSPKACLRRKGSEFFRPKGYRERKISEFFRSPRVYIIVEGIPSYFPQVPSWSFIFSSYSFTFFTYFIIFLHAFHIFFFRFSQVPSTLGYADFRFTPPPRQKFFQVPSLHLPRVGGGDTGISDLPPG